MAFNSIRYTPEQRDPLLILGLDFSNEGQYEGNEPTWDDWNGLGIDNEVNPEQDTVLQALFNNGDLIYYGDYGGGGSGRPQ